MFVNEITKPNEVKTKKTPFSYDVFLEKIVKIENVKNGGLSKDNWHKIRVNKVIRFYSKAGKIKHKVILWDTKQSKTRHIDTEKQLLKLIKEIE
jgi:hypothetical protein